MCQSQVKSHDFCQCIVVISFEIRASIRVIYASVRCSSWLEPASVRTSGATAEFSFRTLWNCVMKSWFGWMSRYTQHGTQSKMWKCEKQLVGPTNLRSEFRSKTPKTCLKCSTSMVLEENDGMSLRPLLVNGSYQHGRNRVTTTFQGDWTESMRAAPSQVTQTRKSRLGLQPGS